MVAAFPRLKPGAIDLPPADAGSTPAEPELPFRQEPEEPEEPYRFLNLTVCAMRVPAGSRNASITTVSSTRSNSAVV